MVPLQHALVLIILNDKLTYWCDYAVQTIHLLSAKNTVVVFCSEDAISWKDVFTARTSISCFEKKWNALLFHPFFFIPGQRFEMIKLLNYQINARFLHWYLQKISKQKKKIFWFFDPLYITSLISPFSDYLSVYDCVDYYQGVSKQLQMKDQFLLRTATVVFANSKTLVRKFRAYRSDIHLVPLGFAKDVFEQAKVHRTPKEKHTIIGFVGGITRRIDYRLLTVVAKRFPEIIFQFYGACRADAMKTNGKLDKDIETYFSLPNVRLEGPVLKMDIPSVIASFDLCIIPYRTEDTFNRYCFPMKVMEYFYMGKPVLATPIEELKRFPKFVSLGATPEEWEFFIRALLSRPWPVQYQREQRKIANVNSWEKKISYLTEYID
ncbi:MAG: glycosyltransferase [Microgenomates group bacterium]